MQRGTIRYPLILGANTPLNTNLESPGIYLSFLTTPLKQMALTLLMHNFSHMRISSGEIPVTAQKRGTSFIMHEAQREKGNKHYVSEKKLEKQFEGDDYRSSRCWLLNFIMCLMQLKVKNGVGGVKTHWLKLFKIESSQINPRFAWPLAAFTSHHRDECPIDALGSIDHFSTECPCCKPSRWFISIGSLIVAFQLCWAQQEASQAI